MVNEPLVFELLRFDCIFVRRSDHIMWTGVYHLYTEDMFANNSHTKENYMYFLYLVTTFRDTFSILFSFKIPFTFRLP